jgi:hypothetical protein
MASRRVKLISVVAVIVIFFLLTTPRFGSQRNLMIEFRMIIDENGTYWGDGSKGKPYYGDVTVGEFNETWAEFNNPMLNVPWCDPKPYTNVQVGAFLDHEFLNATQLPQNLQKDPQNVCYGIKSKLLENKGYENMTQVYSSCYGVRFVLRSNCIIM